MLRLLLVAVVLITCQLTAVRPALAKSGDPDPSFGTGGTVTTNFDGSNDGLDRANALVIQADGKLVAAGGAAVGSSFGFGLARYNSDGTLDTTFGTSGTVATILAGGGSEAQGLVIQADGKLVAAGSFSAAGGGNSGFALARYNSDGTLDTTFGTGGTVTTVFAGLYASANALAVQADGKLVAAGGTPSPTNFALARYNSDGTLDTTFGTGGMVITSSGGGSITALAVQTDGKLVAAGGGSGGTTLDFALARFNPDGTLDTGFGIGGKVTTDVASRSDYAYALAMQTDGKLVAAGWAFDQTSNPNFALARYNPDGTLDTGFGTGGTVTTDFEGSYASDVSALAVQTDGKLVAAGSTVAMPGADSDFAVARYKSNGTLDRRFGTGGTVITDFPSGYPDMAKALALQTDGKLVVAGFADTTSSYMSDFALARYLPDS